MRDLLNCPVCNNKFQNLRWQNHYLWLINKESDFMERKCQDQDHSISLFTDLKTKEINFLKVSQGTKAKPFVGLDFHNRKTIIGRWQENVPKYVSLPIILELDFPKLIQLKATLDKYIK